MNMGDDISDDTCERRSKRQKRDTSYKSKAFEKFKQLKEGTRKKYEVEEMENVYEVVDEMEYTKKVLSRQDDDWIVDDDGSGYIEDGRDIFDDDLDKDSIKAGSSNKMVSKGTKRKKASMSEAAVKGNLKLLFSNMPNKKREEGNLDDDAALSEVLDEIDSSVLRPLKVKPISQGLRKFAIKQVEQDYVKHLSAPPVNLSLKTLEPKPISISKNLIQGVASDSVDLKLDESILDINNINNVSVLETVQIEKKTEESKIEDFSLDTPACFDDDLDITHLDEISNKMETQIDEKIDKIWETIENEMQNEWTANQDETELNTTIQEPDEIEISSRSSDKFKFFWWDAYEDVSKQPGVVFLFGKTFDKQKKSYVSCCVVMKNIERKLFFLPRITEKNSNKEVTLQDVYKEIAEKVMKDIQVKEFKARPISKKFAFDLEVPAESEYIEVRYSAKDTAFEKDISGRTFSRVFGIGSSFLEILLLDQKIKGPCWLEISDPIIETNPISYCRTEIVCTKATQLSIVNEVTERPPLTVASINIRRAINPKTLTNEIVMFSCVTNTSYYVNKQVPKVPYQKHFCAFTSPGEQVLPLNIFTKMKEYKATRLQKMDSERALLNYFLNQWVNLDVDLLVGHDLQGYQINIICERLAHYQISNFDKFGRLKRKTFIKQKLERDLFLGRLVCDIKISAKELIKSKSYDLDALCQTVLKMEDGRRIDLEPEDVAKMFLDSDDILKLVSLTMQDTANILKIMFTLNIIPLALQITNIAGNVMSKTLLGGRSERNEFLLLHAFNEKDYIVPDKIIRNRESNLKTKEKKKASYAGGLVLEPKVGFYDRFILLMDFNSLYPSIIQEYNICFTTMPAELSETNIVLPSKDLPYGILPAEIRKLVESRREVKKLMQNVNITTDLRMQYDIRQMALKLTANSMYGCLGFSNSRFYAKNLAALITHQGREILINTQNVVQRMNYEVIYGDTDSLMINTNSTDYDQVYRIGREIKANINKLYKQVELDIDGVFQYLLLLKKKKYASVTLHKNKDGTLTTSLEYKGLDVVRRDWSSLASEAGKFIVRQILSAQSPDDRSNNILNHLRQIHDDLKADMVPITLLVITKQLTKNPSLYADANAQSHVLVALRANRNGGHFRAGDTVPYVICTDGTTNSATQRAYLVDELKSNANLKIDIKYYLSQQIFPVVTRICEPIDELDPYLIGECLGVERIKIENKTKMGDVMVGEFSTNITQPEVKFANVEKFSFECAVCGNDNKVDGPMRHGNVPVLERCQRDGCEGRPIDYLTLIENQIVRTINKAVNKYYVYTMQCEDPMCENQDVRLPMKFAGRFPVCTLCGNGGMVKKYTERELYLQLAYLSWIWDLSKIAKKPLMEAKLEESYDILKDTTDKRLKFCGYSAVQLSKLFETFTVNRKVDQYNKDISEDKVIQQ